MRFLIYNSITLNSLFYDYFKFLILRRYLINSAIPLSYIKSQEFKIVSTLLLWFHIVQNCLKNKSYEQIGVHILMQIYK